jgi:multisubunit Na+/H+ antiporter MnhC subunit
MRIVIVIITGVMLSNCAAVKMITGHSIQAQDVISSINTVSNLQKYSEPAAREELENRIKQMARSIEAGAEVQ